MSGGCQHIALFTNHPGRLTDFYIKKLGFKKEKESPAPKSIIKPIFGLDEDCRLIKLNGHGIRLEIISLKQGGFKSGADNSVGYSHWAYGVKDKVKFCKGLERKKIGILKARRNGDFICFIKDPDGNRIEIQEY